jgi:hypothetical protein
MDPDTINTPPTADEPNGGEIRISNWAGHRTRTLAEDHAKRLQELTGDLCIVEQLGRRIYRVLRYDPGGKLVI